MLVPNQNNCGAFQSSASGVVADAGQFFEKVTRARAIVEAQEL